MHLRQHLENAVVDARASLSSAEAALLAWDSLPENNVYDSLEEALEDIEDTLRKQASADCEGSHHVGEDTYEQSFKVGSRTYTATLTCEYNRHDKRYYYLEEAKLSCEEITD